MPLAISFFLPFYLFLLFIYLVLVALGLCCCVRAFSSCEWGLLFVVVRGRLMVVAFLVERRLWVHGPQ